jgi:hypothetical protein
MLHDDPEERTGTGQKADPKSTPVKKPNVKVPVVAVPGSQSAQRKAWEAASAETAAARVELIEATKAFRTGEHDEGAAMAAWSALNRPSPDAVVREYLKREGAMREANVAAGLPANQRGPVETPSQWPITLAAKARGRGGPPLRSPVARRVI